MAEDRRNETVPSSEMFDQILQDLQRRRKVVPEPRFNCPLCEDTGYLVEDRDSGRVARECKPECFCSSPRTPQEAEAALRSRGLRSRDIRSAINPWLAEMDGARCPPRPVAASFWASKLDPKVPADPWLFIFAGEKGRGKTKAMAMIVMELINRGYRGSIRWFDVAESAELIMRDRMLGREAKFEIEDRMRSASIAVFDDLTAIKTNSTKREHLATVLDDRYRNERATLISLNMEGASLESAIEDPRLLTRLMSGTLVKLNGVSDLRTKKVGNSGSR